MIAGFAQGLQDAQKLQQQREQLEMQKMYYGALSKQAMANAELHDVQGAVAKQALQRQMQLSQLLGGGGGQGQPTGDPPSMPTSADAGTPSADFTVNLPGQQRIPGMDERAQMFNREPGIMDAITGFAEEQGLARSPVIKEPGSVQSFTAPGQPAKQPQPGTVSMMQQNPLQALLAKVPQDVKALLPFLPADKAMEAMLEFGNPKLQKHTIAQGDQTRDQNVNPYTGAIVSEQVYPHVKQPGVTASANDVALELFGKNYEAITPEERKQVKATQQRREVEVASAKLEGQKQVILDTAGPIAEVQARAHEAVKTEVAKAPQIEHFGVLATLAQSPQLFLPGNAGAPARMAHAAKLRLDFMKGSDPLLGKYQFAVDGLRATLAREAGEVGNLAQAEQERAKALVPDLYGNANPFSGAMKLPDSQEVALQKMKLLGDFLQSSLEAPQGVKAQSRVQERMRGILKQLDQMDPPTVPTQQQQQPAPQPQPKGQAQAAQPTGPRAMTDADRKVFKSLGSITGPHEEEAVTKGWSLGRSAEDIAEQIRQFRADKLFRRGKQEMMDDEFSPPEIKTDTNPGYPYKDKAGTRAKEQEEAGRRAVRQTLMQHLGMSADEAQGIVADIYYKNIRKSLDRDIKRKKETGVIR